MPYDIMVLVLDATAETGSNSCRRMIRRSTSPRPSLSRRFFLYFAGPFFLLTFAFQLGIHADFAGDPLDRALHFVKHAFRLVLRAGFHGILFLPFFCLTALYLNLDMVFSKHSLFFFFTDDQFTLLLLDTDNIFLSSSPCTLSFCERRWAKLSRTVRRSERILRTR